MSIVWLLKQQALRILSDGKMNNNNNNNNISVNYAPRFVGRYINKKKGKKNVI